MTGRITVPAASIIPQGVGAPPPPGLDPKKGKLMCIKVRMLDDTIGVFHLGHKALGSALFDEVCRHLNLLECDYFGLEFLDITGNRCWLDKEKPILRQITSARSDARFFFIVKFYPPNPTDVEEEYTRFLFAAQIKRDLASGQLVVNENTAALMASYIVQSECGDYCAEDYPDHTYLSAVHFIPNQSADFEKQVMENHRKLIGLGPADSDLQLLEVARRVEFYGIKFHPAKDIEGTSVNLCVLHLGVKVYHQLTCANTFSWAKIRKLSFKRKKFLIKLHPDSFAYYKDTIEFIFESRNECKMFWKKCIEHHSFFRCSQVPNRSSANKQQQSRFFNHGSSFRYSGRTHQQLLDYIREHHRRREPFTRPVHSSYNKCNYEQRSLPRSIVPSVRQNGGAVLNTGDDYLSSRTSTLNGPIMAEYSAGATDNYERRPPSSEAPYIDDTTILVGPPPAPVEDPSYSILRHKVKDSEDSNKPIENKLLDVKKNKVVEQSISLIHQLSQYSSNDSTKSRDLVSESTDILILRKNDRISTEDKEQTFPIERTIAANGGSVSPPTEKDQRSSSHDLSQRSKNTFDLSSSCASFPVAPPFTPSGSVLQSDQEMCYSSDQGAGSVEKSSRANLRNHAYQIVKELLMLERTYNNDLKLCLEFESTTNSIVSSLEEMPPFDDTFFNLKSIRDLQTKFLIELEQRISSWESRVSPLSQMPEHQVFKVGDVLLREIHNSNQAYEKYISNIYEYCEKILLDLHVKNAQFQALCTEFESRPQCYIPVAKLLLKPLNRVLSRQAALSKLVLHYIDQGGHNPDLSECKVALDKINALIKNTSSYGENLENVTKLIEIEHDFVGLNIESLYRPVKKLLRQGGLLKVTKRDLSPRLILLFEDAVVHASQTNDGHAMRITFTFKGALNLKGLTIEDGNALKDKLSPQNKHRLSNNEMYTSNCFTLYNGNRSLVLCASTSEQKQNWMEDISRAVMRVKENVTLQTFIGGSFGAKLSSNNGLALAAKTSSSSIDDLGPSTSTTNENVVSSPTPCPLQKSGVLSSSRATISSTSAASTLERFWHHRANDSLHICIHRMVSLTNEHYEKMANRELSGYLLRKFRNSLGWQQLWVVYCNFCLFFYKSHEDDSPLAGLPLLGYSLADAPDPQSNIRKEFVFKLHYRTHYYYFRTNSEYSFRRWIECLKSSCSFEPSKSE